MLLCFTLSSITFSYTCIEQPLRASHISTVVTFVVFNGLTPILHMRFCHIFKCNAYSHSLDTHEMHIPIYTQCFLRTGCNFVSTRVCILMAFFRWYPIHNVFGGLWQTHHASLRSTLSFAPRVSWSSFTLCLAPHSHCATFSLAPCCVRRSHRVVNICVAPALSLAITVYTLYSVHFIPYITTWCVSLFYSSLPQCLLYCCNCIAHTVAYQSLPCTMSCSLITLYCDPPQRVSAVLSIPTLQWYTWGKQASRLLSRWR